MGESAGFIWQTYLNSTRNFHMVFQGGCAILHSHQQRMHVTTALYPYYLVLSIFLNLIILIDDSGSSVWF